MNTGVLSNDREDELLFRRIPGAEIRRLLQALVDERYCELQTES